MRVDSSKRISLVEQKAQLDSKPHRVTYEVSGSATSASLTYRNGQGGTEQQKVSLPFTESFTSYRGDFLYISAQNQDETGTITSSIKVNGLPLKQSTSGGAYSIASASAKCCE